MLCDLLPPARLDLSPAALCAWPTWTEDPGGETGRRAAHPPIDALLALFRYEGPVREAIIAIKYGGCSHGASALAAALDAALAQRWADLFPDAGGPAIVPVPLHPWKYLVRGFNLPALIGYRLAARRAWPFAPCVLRRAGRRPPQAGLPLRDRAGNVAGAFRVPGRAKVPRRVLLLDDVYTSGATAAACATALKREGAEHIVVLTVARTVL